MKFFQVFLIFSLIFFQEANSQNTEEWRIEQVVFEGLKRTKTSFLLPFLKTKKNEIPIDSLLELDVQRLKNIMGIGDVHYRLDTLEQAWQLTFNINELQTLLPIVKYGGIKDNFWFQLGITDINWIGRGQHLSAFYQNTDRRHSGQIYYRIPYFRGNNWGGSINLRKWASREPLYFPEDVVTYDYDNNSIGFSVLRHFGVERNLELGGTYFVEKYFKIQQQNLDILPGPPSLRQVKLLEKLEYKANFINYDFFYLDGYNWSLTQQSIFNTSDETWFQTFQFSGKRFFRIKENGNLALRLKLAISTNNDTPFAPFVVDSHVNIRGAGNRIDRGTAQAVLNIEHRHTLFFNKVWAAQSVLFLDSGTWRNPGGKLVDVFDRTHFRQFVGGGLRVIYQKIYGAVFRIDYGIDVFNKEEHGFVVGLGQYF